MRWAMSTCLISLVPHREEPRPRGQHTRRRNGKDFHPRSSKARRESFCPLDKDLSWKSPYRTLRVGPIFTSPLTALPGITFSLLGRCPTFPTDPLLATMKIRGTMHFPALNLSTRARGLLALLLFLIAWLLGNVGLIAGFEKEAKALGAATFAMACVLWWISYKISCSANGRGITLGVVALSVWMLNLVGGVLLNFHYWIAAPFSGSR